VRTLGLIALLIVATPAGHADTPAEAFAQGRALGATASPALGREIGSGAAAPNVPQYSTVQPQSGLFAGGNGLLVPPGAAQVSGCQVNPADPDPRKQQQCDATNFLARRSTAASFTVPPNDPLIARARPITGDPTSILGSVNGTYSACTPQQVSAPARKQIEVCAESRAPEERRCSKILNISVTPNESCVPGTWFTSTFVGAYADGWRQVGVRVHAYCQMNGPVGLYVVGETANAGGGATVLWVDPATGMTAPQVLTGIWGADYHFGHYFDHVGYLGGSCSPDSCSFGFEVYAESCGDQCLAWDWEGNCTSWTTQCARSGTQASGWLTFPRPRISYAVSDRWDNQCAALEARLP
jgi:hypothetical protein